MMPTAAAVPGLSGDRAAELAGGAGVLLALAAVAALLRWRRRRARLAGAGPAHAQETAAELDEAEDRTVTDGVADSEPTADGTASPGDPPRDADRDLRGSRRAWLRSAQDGSEYLLAWQSTRIGRAAGNDVVLSDPSVSRHHAVLHHADEAWWLLPEVTANGTFYNDHLAQPGERIRVGDGDLLRFGLAPALRLSAPRPQDRPETLHFVSAARSTPGSGRRGNEDVHLATDLVIAVADGVGGRNAGRVAARTAIQYVAQAENAQSAALSVQAAHAAILAQADAEPPLRGMATTLDVARLRIVAGRVVIEGAHVGDGFAIVQDTSGTQLMTRPDTAGQRLREFDPAGAERMENDPDFNRIVAAVGFDGPLRQHAWTLPATVGHRVLLSSDGLLRAVSCEDVIDVMVRHRDDSVDALADHLLRLGIKADDNVTVVVADIDVGPARHWRGSARRPADPGSAVARGDPIGTAEEGLTR
jgi:PPM family protein phosphatase